MKWTVGAEVLAKRLAKPCGFCGRILSGIGPVNGKAFLTCTRCRVGYSRTVVWEFSGRRAKWLVVPEGCMMVRSLRT